MDSFIPENAAAGMSREERLLRRRRSRHLVVSGRRRHKVLELTDHGFVIEAEGDREGDPEGELAGLPRLRGFVDILKGDERIARRLAQFAWARDGLVGYEFKQDAGARDVAADYVKPEAAALLDPPADPSAEPEAP